MAPRTREELYERIRATSRDEFILEEMIRLGFWPSGGDVPGGAAGEIRRIGELERELAAVRTELRRLMDEERMRREIRKRRMLEAKQRREETKTRREEERVARAEAWKQEKTRDIVYLGEGVSGGLGKKETEPARLEAQKLPVLGTAEELAKAMDISVGELRFLAFSRKVSKTTHYKRFYIPKKTGGERMISAPMPRLKLAQYWVLENILAKVPVHESAHGFLTGKSIVSNAGPHVGKDVVINIDLKDFFPTLTYRRVKGMFKGLGYSEQVATILGLICTEPEIDEVVMDDETYYVAKGPRFLPQGAPSSPMITNIICRRLDKRLVKLAESFGFAYTRYADDITFSGDREKTPEIGKLLGKTGNIVRHEGFTVHRDKTRVLHRGRQQEVTGIVVNNKLSVDRKTLRRLRAVLFQLEKDGIKDKTWKTKGDGSADIIRAVEGYAHFVAMVDEAKGAALLEKINAIKTKHKYKGKSYRRYGKGRGISKWKHPAKATAPGQSTGTQAQSQDVQDLIKQAEKEEKSKKWWKFW